MTHSPSPLPYTDDVETIPPDESVDVQSVIDSVKLLLTRTRQKSGRFRADVHVKTHGYAVGELRVPADLPEPLAQGLFERPGAFAAVVRFSNSAPRDLPDAVPDGRGMAIKVYDVPGPMLPGPKLPGDEQERPTQDFVMINHPVFFARNVKDFSRLEQVVAQADGSPLATLQGALTGGDWNPLHWHWREMLTVARIAGQLPAHPANPTYYSATPFRFGKYVAKYRAQLASGPVESQWELLGRLGTQADALRHTLENTLRRQELLFDFQVQLRSCETSMPIEDATVAWPESESPFQTVARLALPRQEIESLRRQEAFQNLAFNVWNAMASHRPLGGVNRVRRPVYAISAAWRRRQLERQATDAAIRPVA